MNPSSRRNSSVPAGKGTVEPFRVFLRIRPYFEAERLALREDEYDDTRSAVECNGAGELLLMDERCLAAVPTVAVKAKKTMPRESFTEVIWSFGEDPPKKWDDEFEHVNRGQGYVFRAVNSMADSNMLQRLYSGLNHMVMCYGAMNCGKTYSMFGDAADPGMAPRFLEKIASKAAKQEAKNQGENLEVSVQVRLARVWKETIEDPLANFGKERTDGVQRAVYKSVPEYEANATSVPCKTDSELHALVAKLQKVRKPSSKLEFTKDNRSHAVLMVSIVQTSRFADPENENKSVQHTKQSLLTLVDLGTAGRSDTESAQDARLISSGPQALARVFQSLTSKVSVPYRDSVLTQILQDQLGGNCNVTILGCLSPFVKSQPDTLLTLDTLRKLTTVNSTVFTREDKQYLQLKEIAAAHQLIKARMAKETTAVQKVQNALHERQMAINQLSEDYTKLRASLKKTQRDALLTDNERQSSQAALQAMKAFRRALLPTFDVAIKEARAEKAAVKKKCDEAALKVAGIEKLDDERGAVTESLLHRVDKLATLVGTAIIVTDVSPIDGAKFDRVVAKVTKLIEELEKRLQSRKRSNAECQEIMEDLQETINESETLAADIEEAVRHNAKLLRSVEKAKEECLQVLCEDAEPVASLKKRGSLSSITSPAAHSHASRPAFEEKSSDLTAVVQSYIRDIAATPVTDDEAFAKMQVARRLIDLCEQEHDRRSHVLAAYSQWTSGLPSLAAYKTAVVLHEKTKQNDEAQQRSRAAQAEVDTLNAANEELTDKLYERQELVAKQEGELEALKLAYKAALEEARWHREQAAEQKKRDQDYAEDRKRREDALALAQLEAQKQKEKGGCCALS